MRLPLWKFSLALSRNRPEEGRGGDGSELLASYLFGLALGGLLTGGRRYHLRSGCDLVPAGAARWEAVYEDGERRPVELAREGVIEELRALAREWSEAADVKLGGEPEVHRYDPARARRMLKEKTLEAEPA